MKTHVLAFGVALAATCFPAFGQWAVVDVQAIAQLTKQVQQGAQQVQHAQNQYNHMKAMAQRMYGLARYRSPKNIFEAVRYADQYAQLGAWATGSNTGQNVDQGYAAATVAAKANDFLDKMTDGLASSTRAMYATQEIMDGHNLAAIKAVGQIRNAASQYEAAINELEKDSTTESDAAQAQLAVEQRTSNAMLVNLRQNKDLIALTSAQLDLAIAQTKLQRDQLAESGNWLIRRQEALEQTTSVYDGAADSWMKWSLSTLK